MPSVRSTFCRNNEVSFRRNVQTREIGMPFSVVFARQVRGQRVECRAGVPQNGCSPVKMRRVGLGTRNDAWVRAARVRGSKRNARVLGAVWAKSAEKDAQRGVCKRGTTARVQAACCHAYAWHGAFTNVRWQR